MQHVADEGPETGRDDGFGSIMYDNYGTWSTATTSKWGTALKAILDTYDNIGTIISKPDFYIDVEEYLKNGTIRAGLNGMEEACGEPFFRWYKEWAKVDYPSTERYTPVQQIPDDPFEFSSECFRTKLLYENSHYEKDKGINSIRLTNNGRAGWRYDDAGLDLSMHDSLIVELAYPARFASKLKIFDTSNFWANTYYVELNNQATRFAIPLHDMTTASGKRVDESRIRMVAFTTEMPQEIQVKSIYFAQTFYDGITNVRTTRNDGVLYDLTGRAIDRSKATKGVYILNGKKVRL